MTNQHNPEGSSWEDVWEYPEPVHLVREGQPVVATSVVPAMKEVAKRGPGRPPLPAEERARRKAEQKVRYAARAEAKRKAAALLQERHAEEFERLFNGLLNAQAE